MLRSGVSLAAAIPVLGQQSPARFSVDVKVVNVTATVRNERREIVRDLTQDDFILEEDGHPQEIRYFARQAELPLTLGLAVDTSGSQWRLLIPERTASERFLEQVIREDRDRAFVIRFDLCAEVLGDISSSRQALLAALDQLEASDTPGWRRRNPSAPAGYRYGGTILYDAICLATRDVMIRQQGRKALIVLSDGVDNVSRNQPDETIEWAQRADTLVYSVLFSDRRAYSGQRSDLRGKGIEVLKRLSAETGGRYFEVTKKQSLNSVFSTIEQELRSEYSLGYVSNQKSAAGYRKIRLASRYEGQSVQARDGYYAE